MAIGETEWEGEKHLNRSNAAFLLRQGAKKKQLKTIGTHTVFFFYNFGVKAARSISPTMPPPATVHFSLTLLSSTVSRKRPLAA